MSISSPTRENPTPAASTASRHRASSSATAADPASARRMGMGVVPERVPCVVKLAQETRLARGPLAEDEEGRRNAEPVEDLDQPPRVDGIRPVVERQRDAPGIPLARAAAATSPHSCEAGQRPPNRRSLGPSSTACQALRMPRWGLVAAGTAVFLGVTSQILVPSLGEREIEERLTAGGGEADVTLGAFPAARLLFSDGERFEVEASDLELALDPSDEVFERLDGFSIVEISIADSKAGPIELERFELTRDGGPIPPQRRRHHVGQLAGRLRDRGGHPRRRSGDVALDLFGIETDYVCRSTSTCS